MDNNKKKSDLAVEKVKEYLEKQDYKAEDVTKKKEHKGYDILATRNNEKIKIEVKGCQSEKGIPDCHDTLFNEDRTVVADYFYIVRFDEKLNVKRIEILSKEEMDRYTDSHKWIKRLRTTTLDTDLFHEKIGKRINF